MSISVERFEAGELSYRLAHPEDGPKLQGLLRDNPLSSWIRLRFERAPDYFAADRLFGRTTTVIAERGEETVGMYSCAWLPLFVDGEAQEIPYLGSLRVAPASRHRIRVLKQGYRSLTALLPLERPTLCFTSIASENHEARRILEANLNGMPRYRFLGEMHTLALPTARGRAGGRLRPATMEEGDELAAFHNRQAARRLFAPVLDGAWLRRLDGSNGLRPNDFLIHREGGRIRACLALWDQRAFKQTVVEGYRFPTDRLRPLYNGWAALTRRARLPAAGETLRQLYLAFLALDDDLDPIALLREALHHARARSAEVAVLGLAADNPLLAAVTDHFPCHRYRTRIETVTPVGEREATFDGRSPQPEVALL